MFWCFDIFGQFFCFCFDVLVVQEDINQCVGFIGMGQWDKVFIFQYQGFFMIKMCGGFNGFDCGDWCWVMFFGGLCDYVFGNCEVYGGFNFVEFQWFQFWLMFCFLVQVVIYGLMQDCQCVVVQFFCSDYVIYQVDFQCLIGVDVFFGGNNFQCVIGVEQVWQMYGIVEVWYNVEFGFWQFNVQVWCCQVVIGCQYVFVIVVQCIVIDGRDSGDGEIFQMIEDVVSKMQLLV